MEDVVQMVWDARYPQNEAWRRAQERLRKKGGEEEGEEEREMEGQRGAGEAIEEDAETGCRRRKCAEEPPKSPEGRGKRRRQKVGGRKRDRPERRCQWDKGSRTSEGRRKRMRQ